ncbi:Hypothetical_protein [Hexamita inflata]|uniref:Hypothetical_protein n=1 Tax=Hexamita inflata TaxID=28002 RepID=A0AA86U4H8_9EUKA|nr:Hypothetical protein HINF_LOCUS29835 [Hexamita inflata]
MTCNIHMINIHMQQFHQRLLQMNIATHFINNCIADKQKTAIENQEQIPFAVTSPNYTFVNQLASEHFSLNVNELREIISVESFATTSFSYDPDQLSLMSNPFFSSLQGLIDLDECISE